VGQWRKGSFHHYTEENHTTVAFAKPLIAVLLRSREGSAITEQIIAVLLRSREGSSNTADAAEYIVTIIAVAAVVVGIKQVPVSSAAENCTS
jgi:hypothetical protein